MFVFWRNPSHQSQVYLLYPCLSTVPLRTPELSLTSHSSTDIQVNWQPLPAKVSRGRLSAYRLSYRTAADNTVTSVEIPQNRTEYLLESLQPDTIYLLRMAAATRVGWCEPSAWTSHRTPKTSSSKGKHAEDQKRECRHKCLRAGVIKLYVILVNANSSRGCIEQFRSLNFCICGKRFHVWLNVFIGSKAGIFSVVRSKQQGHAM